MFTRSEIIEEVGNVQRESAAFWGRIETPEFFASLGDAWSPADNVRHLIMSVRAVVKGLSVPRIALWWRFGKSGRPSQSYDEVRDRYVAIPEKKAGRFTPSPRNGELDPDSRRTSLLGKLDEAHRELADSIGGWSESDLDRYQMPHPILGNLTVREMLFFTIYHARHHMAGVQRRRG